MRGESFRYCFEPLLLRGGRAGWTSPSAAEPDRGRLKLPGVKKTRAELRRGDTVLINGATGTAERPSTDTSHWVEGRGYRGSAWGDRWPPDGPRLPATANTLVPGIRHQHARQLTAVFLLVGMRAWAAHCQAGVMVLRGTRCAA
jgi:hypothetical protein